MKYLLRLWLLRILGALLRLSQSSTMTVARERPKILLLRPDHLGDVLLSRPAVDALALAVPNAQLTIAVGPWGRPALGTTLHYPVLLFSFPGFSRSSAGPLRPYLLLLRYAMVLRRGRYDMAVVLRPDHWWGALLVALAGIPVRVGYDTPEAAPFLSIALPLKAGTHAVEQAFALTAAAARAAGSDVSLSIPPLPSSCTAADRMMVTDLLSSRGIGKAVPLLVLHPGAGAPLKSWILTRFAEVGAELCALLDARLVITGTESEQALIMRLVTLLPGAVSLAGDLTWGQLEAVLERASLVIGVDSGPLHLAVAARAPSVALFGPADPAQFAPWGPQPLHQFVAAELPCRPCRRLDYCALEPESTSAPPCMRAITVNMVSAAARSVTVRKETGAAATE